MTCHIALLGCGNMGGALLQGWLGGGIDADFTVIEPHGLPEKFHHSRITHIQNVDESVRGADVVLLAVKPQILKDACAPLRNKVKKDALIISIAAGQSLNSLESLFPAGQPVVRVMPNTPAAIGKGTSGLIGNKYANDEHRAWAEQLMRCAGAVEWVPDEKIFNAITALSANGPAYVFYLIEVLSEAAKKAGLDQALAERMARQTVIGAAALAEKNAETDVQTLRKNVTSPGGTTEAALKILMNGEMQKLFDAAIAAGAKRGEELNQ
ncbi:MAG: pyrroline-5-carboxylate reductase [Alphaproteobacteria bacterium]